MAQGAPKIVFSVVKEDGVLEYAESYAFAKEARDLQTAAEPILAELGAAVRSKLTKRFLRSKHYQMQTM